MPIPFEEMPDIRLKLARKARALLNEAGNAEEQMRTSARYLREANLLNLNPNLYDPDEFVEITFAENGAIDLLAPLLNPADVQASLDAENLCELTLLITAPLI